MFKPKTHDRSAHMRLQVLVDAVSKLPAQQVVQRNVNVLWITTLELMGAYTMDAL